MLATLAAAPATPLCSPLWDPLVQASAKLPAKLRAECNEVRLLHGTSPQHLLNILKDGFNERYAGSTAGQLLGAGAYFAEQIDKADQYAVRDEGSLQGTYTAQTSKPHPVTYERSALQALHQQLYNAGTVVHQGDVFYVVVSRVVLGEALSTLDAKSAVAPAGVKGKEIFHSVSKRELRKNPVSQKPFHSLIGESCPHPSLPSGRCSHGCQLRRREFVTFHATRAYPEYVIAYKRI